MGTSQIYEIRNSERLDDLLRDASSGDGAKLLIPDLQRPYVWSPAQVILLIDSLLHGWPFGTLLLWNVEDAKLADIPHRSFWRVVDRTEESDKPGVPELAASLPAKFRMVLDGQQRLQSLVLGLGGDGNGFRLTDRQWFDGLDRERPRGRATAHWSFGQLCLDIPAFVARTEGEVAVRGIDYRDVLAWVVRAGQDGVSASKQPGNYTYPLPTLNADPGRFVSMPRLWKLAGGTAESEFTYLKKLRNEFLPAQNLSDDMISRVAEPLATLVKVFEEVKASPVGVLELRPFTASVDDPGRYADAIVNIFTRLNTAGRTLTTQEITFAWIKAGWGEGPGIPAEKAFRNLRTSLSNAGLEVTIDEAVQAVAQVWAVLDNGGIALGPKDLLRGERVRPMIPGITSRWLRLADNVVRVARIVQHLELTYGRHFQSLNAFLLLSHWRMVGEEWMVVTEQKGLAKIAWSKALDELVRSKAERWLALTSWAGRWRESSGENVLQYLRDLAACWKEVSKLETGPSVRAKLSALMDGWCAAAAPAAESFVRDKLDVERREDVRAYFFPLWIWHRMDVKRRDWSSVHMDAARSRPSLEVDHIAAVALWDRAPPALDRTVTPEDVVNDLGNMFLLEKNFNIGKSDKPLLQLLGRVEEIGDDGVKQEAFLAALAIDQTLAEPSARTREDIQKAIDVRGALIREELAAYVRGDSALVTVSVPDVSGIWECEMMEGNKKYVAKLELSQTGSIVEGEYVYDPEGSRGSLFGKLRDTTLVGTWKEKNQKGPVEFTFSFDSTATGGTFFGKWETKNGKSSGPWTGKWMAPASEP